MKTFTLCGLPNMVLEIAGEVESEAVAADLLLLCTKDKLNAEQATNKDPGLS
jgi:hypothetical protein